eukprot:NODE_2020_length_1006_cov_97.904911_g1646_i0.p1 GENE.NODE_2020_length_1006_cov_97.904911_g1646_i0~~NODE_2020_length_1006_cov_97.904911_g1646_i0.p1  ORF type:complete len:260 (+),score=63.63 NODE_2020_length_1006_cov_97.904911_g1646_i0:81-860(+)
MCTLCEFSTVDKNKFAEYSDFVVSTIKNHRGVVELMTYQEIVVVWNAGDIVSGHKALALEAALELSKHNTLKITVAVACGRASVGTLGGQAMRSFMVIGAVHCLARGLLRSAKMLGARIVTHDKMMDAVQTGFNFRVLEKISLAGMAQNNIVYQCLGAQPKAGENEWMYELESQEKAKDKSLEEWNSLVPSLWSNRILLNVAYERFKVLLEEHPKWNDEIGKEIDTNMKKAMSYEGHYNVFRQELFETVFASAMEVSDV